MNKILGLFFILFIVYACSNNDFYEIPIKPVNKECSGRTLKEAIDIANNALHMLDETQTRAVTRIVDTDKIEYVLASHTRNTNLSNIDTLLYVINFTDNNGFAIISGNKATEGLLAITEKGSYHPDWALMNGYENGFSEFVTLAKNYAASTTLNEEGIDKPMELRSQRDTINFLRISPKISVQWGQDDYEGAYAPNQTAGCTNIAMAQIMSYFEYPSQISLTYEGADKNVQILDWEAIKQHKIDHFYKYCSATTETHSAIGRFIRQLGKINQSKYQTDGTGTGTENKYVWLNLKLMG